MHVVATGGSVEEGGGLRVLILDNCSKITVEGIAGLSRFQNLRALSVAFMLSMRDADLLTLCSAHPQLEVQPTKRLHPIVDLRHLRVACQVFLGAPACILGIFQAHPMSTRSTFSPRLHKWIVSHHTLNHVYQLHASLMSCYDMSRCI